MESERTYGAGAFFSYYLFILNTGMPSVCKVLSIKVEGFIIAEQAQRIELSTPLVICEVCSTMTVAGRAKMSPCPFLLSEINCQSP